MKAAELMFQQDRVGERVERAVSMENPEVGVRGQRDEYSEGEQQEWKQSPGPGARPPDNQNQGSSERLRVARGR